METLEKRILDRVRILGVSLQSENWNIGEKLFHQDEIVRDVFYIEEGVLKTSYYTEDGRELIKWFVEQGQMIGSTLGLLHDKPSGFELSCLFPVKAIRIQSVELMKLIESDHELAKLLTQFAFGLASQKEQRELDFLSKSSEQQLKEMYEKKPLLMERLTQNEVAKYLGITAVALSRIKTRLQI